MKTLITIILSLLSLNIIAQENTSYKVGDEVEYFDGLNWIESKIIQIGPNGKYLININRSENQTKWFSQENLQPLFKDDAKIIKTKVEVIETVVKPKFHVADIVKYFENNTWIETSIMNLGPDYTYQIYIDTNKTGVIWKNENELVLISSNYNEPIIEDMHNNSTYSVNDVLEFFEGDVWKTGTIIEISADGLYKFNKSNEWFSTNEIRIISPNVSQENNPEYFEVGNKVIVFDGKKWIESEILQINDYMQYQVFYNVEKTITKWVENKDLKAFK